MHSLKPLPTSRVNDLLALKGERVVTIPDTAPIGDAATLLREENIGAVLVSDTSGSLVGILSERDLVRGFERHGADMAKMSVADLMSRALVTCTIEDPLDEAERSMSAHHIRHLPAMDGTRIAGIISIRDIANHRIELLEIENERLRRHTENWRDFLATYPEAIYVQINGEIVYANPAAVAQFAADNVEQLIGLQSIELFHTDYRETIKKRREAAGGHGRAMPLIEVKHVRLDGSEFYGESNGRQIDWNGQTAVLVVVRDATEQRLAREQISRLHQRLVDAIAIMPGCFALWDEEDRLVLCNEAFRDLLPEHKEVIVPGMKFEDFIALRAELIAEHSGQEAAEQAVQRRLQYHREHRGAHEVQMPDGRWVVISERQTHEGYTVTLQMEITEAKQAEDALRKARDDAEAANKAKSDFVATISHEVRTPMNGVLGIAKLLLETELADEQRDYVETIRQSGEALLKIINDILDFSKLETGKFDLEIVDTGIREVVSSVIDLLEPQARGKGIDLLMAIESNTPKTVDADPGRLRQILLNLVGNAIKFTQEGAVSILVGCNEEDRAKGTVRFSIKDTGEGISSSAQEKLFKRFAQADPSVYQRAGGTGLGLAIAKQLCELMGGNIGLDSAPGEGTTVWFTLPMATQDTDAEGDAPVSNAMGTEAAAAGGPALDILLAEDNLINQKIVIAMLAKAGHRVHVVENGLEAVNAVRDRAFDVVVMDIHMPEMDGVAATESIRALDSDRNNIPIIAFTANAMKGDRERFLAAGMNDYVSKPVDPAVLREAVARNAGVEVAGLDSPTDRGEISTSEEDKERLAQLVDSFDDLVETGT